MGDTMTWAHRDQVSGEGHCEATCSGNTMGVQCWETSQGIMRWLHLPAAEQRSGLESGATSVLRSRVSLAPLHSITLTLTAGAETRAEREQLQGLLAGGGGLRQR